MQLLVLLGPVAVAAMFASCGITADLGGSGGAGGSVGESVSSVSGSGGGAPPVDGSAVGHLAAACASASDCGAGLSCVTATTDDPIFGGGAPNGFCTKPCSADADCESLGGVCYQLDPSQSGRCTLACTLGGPAITGIAGLFDPLDTTKCLGRSDVRCATTGAGSSAVCLPTCGDDAPCDGLTCDPRDAICVDQPSTGSPLGAVCDPAKTTSTCAGVCIGFETGSAMCSDPCVLGATAQQAPLADDCGGPTRGLCAFHPVTSGVGDTGYCTPSCTVQSDCQTPSFWCFSVPELTPQSGVGYCFAATACPHGQGDCDGVPFIDGGVGDGGPEDGGSGDAGARDSGPGDAGASPYTCTDTPAGPYCLDLTYPPGTPDAGTPDAGTPDADTPDAGTPDGGDGGLGDASTADAADGEAPDAGPDDASDQG